MSTEFNLRIQIGNAEMVEDSHIAGALVDVAGAIIARGLPNHSERMILDANGQIVGLYQKQRQMSIKKAAAANGATRRVDGLHARESVVRIMALLGAQEKWSDPSGLLESIAEILNNAHGAEVGSCSDQDSDEIESWRDIANELGYEHDGEN